MTRFPRERTGTAMGIGGIAMGFAPNIGPLIGGALAGSWGWRSFYMHTCRAFSPCCWRRPTLSSGARATATTIRAGAVFDVPVVRALSTLGFGGLLLGEPRTRRTMPLSSPFGVGCRRFCGAGCLSAVFVRQPARDRPSAHLLGYVSRRVTTGPAFVAQNCLFASFMGITLIRSACSCKGICGHLTALDAGIVFVPATVIALFLNPLAGLLTDRGGRTRRVR